MIQKLTGTIEERGDELVLTITIPRWAAKKTLRIAEAGPKPHVKLPPLSANLSPREEQTFVHVHNGMKWREIAERMGVSLSTAKGYGWAMARKLGHNMQSLRRARNAS